MRRRTSAPAGTVLAALLSILTIALLSFSLGNTAWAGDKLPEMIGGVPAAEALRLGERMYREGILPSGAPLKGIVKGDIQVDGTKFTCASCHQRSGFGSMEGTVRTPPVHGTQLYSALMKFKGIPVRRRAEPVIQEELFRPAYTDETLARSLRIGQDPTGRQMNDAMPIYFLEDRDMAIMVHYLKNLSVGNEPGVTDTTLRFATIVTDEVPKADRESMLAPLQQFINNWRISRSAERGMRAESFVQEGASQELRKLSLAVWELKGPEETWRSQLEEYFRREPVFAILGGITTGEWAPVHEFCEANKVPAVFPITDHPVVGSRGGYTFYLTKGLYQEGEAAARYLHGKTDLPKDSAIVQIYRNDRSGKDLSRAFRDTWNELGHPAPEDRVLELGKNVTPDFWAGPDGKRRHAVVLVWLDGTGFPDLQSLAGSGSLPDMLIASSSLLGKHMYSLPEKQRASVYLTYPYSLPSETRLYRMNIEAALKKNNVQVPNPDIYFRMYPLFSTLAGPLARMRANVYRDYFLELLEASQDVSATPVTFPRLSFGTGQRYASKGCYMVQLSEGPTPELVKRSEWITH